MKHLALATLLFATLTAEKCNSDQAGTGGAAQLATVQDAKWVLQSLNGIALKMPEGTTAPWLMLGKEGNQIQGNTGCNALLGTYELAGEKIKFPGMGSTKKYCEETMPTENAFLDAMKRVDSFSMDGGLLKLLGGGAELASFKKE